MTFDGSFFRALAAPIRHVGNPSTVVGASGDSIGFWAGDHLIVHTVDVWPNDYFRGYPPTSNQFESVEIYRRETRPNGADVIVVQTTFCDPIGLTKPLNGVYTFTRATTLEDAGFRTRKWECSANQNTP